MKEESKDDDGPPSAEDLEALDRLILPMVDPIAPTEPVSRALRGRLFARVGRNLADNAGVALVRLNDGQWRPAASGVRMKRLTRGAQGNSVLLQLDPGASLPVHRHHWLEEGIVLSGDIQAGEYDLGPGDYHVSLPGSTHVALRSRHGAVGYVRGTSAGSGADMLLAIATGALSIQRSAGKRILRRDKGAWTPLGDGVESKLLWADHSGTSRFYRFAPGSAIRLPPRSRGDELVVVSGEVFVADVLLRATEFQCVESAVARFDVSSDVGAVVFVRSTSVDAHLPGGPDAGS